MRKRLFASLMWIFDSQISQGRFLLVFYLKKLTYKHLSLECRKVKIWRFGSNGIMIHWRTSTDHGGVWTTPSASSTHWRGPCISLFFVWRVLTWCSQTPRGPPVSLRDPPVLWKGIQFYMPLFMCILLGRESMAFFRFGTPKSLTCGMVPRDEIVHEGKSFGLFSAGTQLLEQSLVHSYCSMCMCVLNESISEWIKWQHWVLNLGCSDPRAVFPAPSPTEEATLVFQEGWARSWAWRRKEKAVFTKDPKNESKTQVAGEEISKQ